MKFENTQVMNFNNAFRGMRNSYNSWDKSDSYGNVVDESGSYDFLDSVVDAWIENENKIRKEKDLPTLSPQSEGEEYVLWEKTFDLYVDWLITNGTLKRSDTGYAFDVFYLGPKDCTLAQNLIKMGSPDRKFLRQISVSVDITAPLYWWKEFDTYKIGTTANSTSTMHKLASMPITIDCFEMDDFNEDIMMYQNEPYNPDIYMSEFWDMFINDLETLRLKYNETKDQRYWKELIRLLPEGWLQTRTVTMNYENLKNMYAQRKHHRLVEWHTFCDWVKTLPYAYEFITFDLDK